MVSKMQKWVVKFDDMETVDILEQMGIISYKPLFYNELKFVFIKTDMTEEEVLKIKGVLNCRKPWIGTFGFSIQ